MRVERVPEPGVLMRIAPHTSALSRFGAAVFVLGACAKPVACAVQRWGVTSAARQ